MYKTTYMLFIMALMVNVALVVAGSSNSGCL